MSLPTQVTFLPSGIPNPDAFISLHQYRSHTPSSFAIRPDSPIVLHDAVEGLRVELVAPEGMNTDTSFHSSESHSSNGHPAGSNGSTVLFHAADDKDAVLRFLAAIGARGIGEGGLVFELDGMMAWVTSHALFLAESTSSPALQIPYQRIAMHALSPRSSPTTSGGIILSLEPSRQQLRQLAALALGPDDEEDIPEGWGISIFISPLPPHPEILPDQHRNREQEFFNAISDCADLHPEVTTGMDDDSDMPALPFSSFSTFPSTGDGHSGFYSFEGNGDSSAPPPASARPTSQTTPAGGEGDHIPDQRRRPREADEDETGGESESSKWRCLD